MRLLQEEMEEKLSTHSSRDRGRDDLTDQAGAESSTAYASDTSRLTKFLLSPISTV